MGNFDRNILVRVSRYRITYHHGTIKFPLKSSMSEIKILPNIPIANFEKAEYGISKLENRSMEITQAKEQREEWGRKNIASKEDWARAKHS